MGVSKTAIDIHAASDSAKVASKRFDWSTVTPTTAIAETLGVVEGCEPDEIGPLYDLVNSDALDALVQASDTDADCAVVFPYGDYSVTVSAPGDVIVHEAAADE
jgi:hypothetical protein